MGNFRTDGVYVRAQSSFKLQRFLCLKGYAMDNLDETQSIHLSLELHPYLQSTMCMSGGEGG